MAKASGDKFFIENILGLKDEEPAILSPVSKGQKRRRLSDESEGTNDQSFNFRLPYHVCILIFR